MEKMTQHQLGQIKQKLSKVSQKFELVAAGCILRFTRNLKIAPTIILPSLLVTRYSLLIPIVAICYSLLTAHRSLFAIHYLLI